MEHIDVLKINGDDVRFQTARILVDITLPIYQTQLWSSITGQKCQVAQNLSASAIHSDNLERNAVRYTEKKTMPQPHMTRSTTAILSETLCFALIEEWEQRLKICVFSTRNQEKNGPCFIYSRRSNSRNI